MHAHDTLALGLGIALPYQPFVGMVSTLGRQFL